MKNFKKVIAFLMVAAMTLGMGLTAFASSTGAAVDVAKVKAIVATPIEEAKAGDTVTIQVTAAQDFYCNACKMHIYLDSNYVKTGNDDVVNDANGFLDSVWKVPSDAAAINYDPATGEVVSDAAGASKNNPNKFKVAAGSTVAELQVVLAADVKEGDQIATVTFEYITDGTTTGTNVDMYPEDVAIVISAKATQSSSDTTTPAPGPDNTTAANNNNVTTAAGGQNATTAAGGNNNAAQTTTKALPKADDIKNVTAALEACADLIENGNYNAVLNIAKKLDASCFTSTDAYNAFAAALKNYEAVLANPNATEQEKIDAYNKLIETMQENVLTQKGKDTLMNNVKAALTTTPATTKTGKGGKTGDTAPVAALMIVAIAAFGTAVVVYRKKVNA